MRKKFSEDEAMHIVGVIPVARLNHIPINYKKYKKTDFENSVDGCLEYKTQIKLKNNTLMIAVYHQWQRDVEESKDLDNLTWVPSWYEFYYDNRGNK